jgi:hypothetical protein
MIRTFWKSGEPPERNPESEMRDEKVDRVRGLVGDALRTLGTIMEQSPLTIFPTSKLPIPTDEKLTKSYNVGRATIPRLSNNVG